jgi:hypothetical protein
MAEISAFESGSRVKVVNAAGTAEHFLSLAGLKAGVVVGGFDVASLNAPAWRSFDELVLASQFTDGGAAVGTFTSGSQLPVGAILIGSKFVVNTGFTGGGQVSCTITIGDGSDVDRYHTGTPSIFTTAANGVESGVPSGNKLLTAANSPVLTITANADITGIIAGPGAFTYHIYYLIS